MESASAPRSRSIAVMAVISVALLLVGFGAGYLLARPAAPTEPGAVDGLNRPSQVPRVQGWYKGQDVAYLDYGPMTNVAEPILVFFQQAAPNTPVPGQLNLIDTIPGQPGYSDFWRVYKVLAPTNYVANTIRSFDAVIASGYTIEATDIIVNCPVVNPGSTIQGSNQPLVSGWYRGRSVVYFDHGANSESEGSVVATPPIYAFFLSDGTPVSGQRNVIDVIPGDGGYSDLWQVVKVVVDSAYTPNSLRDASDILAQATAGGVTLEVAGIYVNCPVVP